MTDHIASGARARRIRNALLASALTFGIVSATGAGFVLSDGQVAVAQPVEQPVVAPTDFTAVVETVSPAVVSVQVEGRTSPVADRMSPEGFDFDFRGFEDLPEDHPFNEFFRRFGEPRGGDDMPGRPEGRQFSQGQGSGFFISEDGYLVTNNHVVEGAEEITIVMDDGTEHSAELIGSDERTDLALLKVEGESFTYVNFAEEAPKVGQWVIAIGNPFGLGGTVTAGIISADGRDIGAGPYDDFLQIDAPVNRGNSGGPTFNTRGEVIGVNTAIFSPSGGNVGIAFAIPANKVQEIVSDLRDDGEVTRGWLGVQIQPVTEDIAESLGVEGTEGAIVADAQANGPAAGAGIQSGDIILEVNGEAMEDPRDLSETIARFEPNTEVTITVLREGGEREIEVTLGDLDDLDMSQMASVNQKDEKDGVRPGSFDGLGLTLEANPDGDGLVVRGVEDGSAAAERGIRAGDVVVSAGGNPVETLEDLEAAIANAEEQGRDAVLFRVEGENGARFVGLPFERG